MQKFNSSPCGRCQQLPDYHSVRRNKNNWYRAMTDQDGSIVDNLQAPIKPHGFVFTNRG